MHLFATLTPETVLGGNKRAYFENEGQAAQAAAGRFAVGTAISIAGRAP